MRLAILTGGTRGDVQPFLSLAWTLQQRGHDVVLCLPDNFVGVCERAGLRARPLGLNAEAILNTESSRQAMARGDVFAFLRMLDDANREFSLAADAAVRETTADTTGILANSLLVERAAVVGEVTGQRLASAHVYPMVSTAAWANALLPLRSFGLGWLNRWTADLLPRLAAWKMGPEINAFRASYGLGPMKKSALEASFTGEAPVIQAFSERVVPRPADWGSSVHVTGWWDVPGPLRAALGEDRVDPDLDAWLQAGPPPVFFGFGSMPILDPPRFLAAIRAVVQTQGVRALVGAGWSALAGANEPALFVAPAFDHSQVLPRCVAAVHHGGSHTTFASLRAGLPTHIASVIADQPFWGRRVRDLGVGSTGAFRKLDEAGLQRAIAGLLRPEVRQRAAALGEQLRREDGLAEAVRIVEARFFSR